MVGDAAENIGEPGLRNNAVELCGFNQRVGNGDTLCAEAADLYLDIRVAGHTGGHELTLDGQDPVSLEALKTAHDDWLPQYMSIR